MGRFWLMGLGLAFFLAGAVGCGASSPPPAEERPGVKARQDMQKDKSGPKYMKPDEK